MNSFPRVTILTPTFNRAEFLSETVESVLAQGYPNLEYLVLDDGSSDNTAEVVSRYGNAVHYHYHQNMGEPRTVNRGWELATGEFVCIVNSDDPQPPVLIRRSVEVMQAHPEVIVTYPDWVMIDQFSHPIKTVTAPDYNFEDMLKTCYCYPGPGAFIRRTAVAPHSPYLRDPRYPLISDFESWCRLGLIGPFLHIPEVLAAWRRHEGAISVQNRPTRRRAEEQIRMVWAFYENPALPASLRRLARFSKGETLLTASNIVFPFAPFAAFGYLARALRYVPRRALTRFRRKFWRSWKRRLRPYLPAPLLGLYRLVRHSLR